MVLALWTALQVMHVRVGKVMTDSGHAIQVLHYAMDMKPILLAVGVQMQERAKTTASQPLTVEQQLGTAEKVVFAFLVLKQPTVDGVRQTVLVWLVLTGVG